MPAEPDAPPAPGTCAVCGAVLPPDAPLGQCPRCLLGFASGVGLEAAELAGAEELLHAGQTRLFGDYELLEEVARGGMGVVFRARHAALGREVALKMLAAGELATPEAVQRFRTEATAAARLEHPNIVPVFEVGEQDLRHFFTMRFVPGGRNVSDWARALPPEGRARVIAAMMARIARALDYAHERGVLHRDLKPSNILVDAQDEPQLTDFGLARLMREADSAVTLTRQILGSPSYMAPEQAEGRRADETTATDVHGLGAVLYEMLSGAPPFVADTPFATVKKVIEQPPARLPGVPRDLETICLKCLEKNPARRYHSALELAEDLERFTRGEPIRARQMTLPELLWSWARRRPVPAALGAALIVTILAGITGVLWQWQRAEVAKENLSATVARLEWRRIVRLLEDGQDARGLAELARLLRENPAHPHAPSFALSVLELGGFAVPLAPPLDHGPGSGIVRAAFSADGGEVLTLDAEDRVLRWDARQGTPLGQAADVPTSVFPDAANDERKEGSIPSPDGSRLARWTPAGLRLSASEGDESEVVCEDSGGLSTVAWSPDGGRVAGGFLGTAGARIWDATSGRALSPRLPHLYGCTTLAFSPDGSVLFTGSTEGLVRRWRASDGAVAPAASLVHPESVMGLAFSPSGDRLLVTLHPWNVRTPRRSGSARLWNLQAHEPDLRRFGVGAADPPAQRELQATVAWSPDGVLCAISAADGRLAVHDAATAAPLWEIRLAGYPRGLAFLPGGRLGVATMGGEIAMLSIESGKPLAGPWQTHALETAFFHPHGRLLATGGLGGQVEVWDLETGRVLARATSHRAPLNGVALSPDGRLVASAGEDGLCIVSDAATGRALFPPLEAEDEMVSIRFSPDGRWIVTASHDRSARVHDSRTGEARGPALRHEGEVVHASFDAQGQRVLTVGREGVARVWDAVSGRPLGEAMRHRTALRSASFSPDGHRVLTEDHQGLRLWDAATGEPLTLTLPHPTGMGIGYDGQGLRALFSPEGRRVLHGTGTSDAVIWSFPEPPLPAPEWLPDLLEAIGGIALDPLGSPVFVPPQRWLELQERLRALEGEGIYEQSARRFAR